jgi:hypothetical protein
VTVRVPRESRDELPDRVGCVVDESHRTTAMLTQLSFVAAKQHPVEAADRRESAREVANVKERADAGDPED